jgi:hypothetical protein
VFGADWLEDVKGTEVVVPEVALAVGSAAVRVAETPRGGGVFGAVFAGEETTGWKGGLVG